MRFRRHNLEDLADLVCGNLGSERPMEGAEPSYFVYRSSSNITRFFDELGSDRVHDGSTRHRWVADVLGEMLNEPHAGPNEPPEIFRRMIDHLMIPADALNEGPDRPNALRQLNSVLTKEGFEAFYGEDGHCYLRHVGTQTVAGLPMNPHRPLTADEQERRDLLAVYLKGCSEDDLIEEGRVQPVIATAAW